MAEGDVARRAQEALVMAAIEQIEAVGLGQVTVRAIADRAGMNVASVSYHFGSKDVLVAAALAQTLGHLIADCEVLLEKLEDEPMAGLVELFGYLLEGALRYPRVTRAHLHDAFVRDDFKGPFPTRFAPIMATLARKVRHAVPRLTPAGANRRVTEAMSAVLFPGFFPGFFAELQSLHRPEARRAYVVSLAERALEPVR